MNTIPYHVGSYEAAQLYYYMVTGKTSQKEYQDERNQIIHDMIEHLLGQVLEIGTSILIDSLTSDNLLEAAGDIAYIEKVFNNYEPMEAAS